MPTYLETKDAQLKELGGKLEAKRKELADLLAEAGPDLDPGKIRSRQVADGKELFEIVTALNAEIDDLRKRYDERQELLQIAERAVEAPVAETAPARTPGELFAASEAYRGYRIGQGVGPVATLPLSLGDILRQATLMQTSAGWAPESSRTGIVSTYPTRPAPHVVDFIPKMATNQAAIKYMEETTFTNAAAETAEGGSFPEAALALTEQTVTVRKVAVFLPVTDEQLEDVEGIRDYVDQRLRFMLAQRVDLQVLKGNGTAPNLLGTMNVTGIQTQAQGSDTLEEATHKLITLIRTDGFAEPSVIFMNGANWETIRLRKTADGVYIYGSPSDAAPERLWGIPVVVTTALATADKVVAGDYVTHAAIFNRRGIDVQVSNAHSTYFVEGKQAIRADVRLAVVHFRPKAFGKVT